MTALQRQADQGIPVAAELWSVELYLKYWLDEVVKPQQRPKTYQGYASVVHNHLLPGLGKKRLDRLTAKDVRQFIKGLSEGCHCCRAGLDEGRGQCCSIGQCCGRRLSRRTVQQAHSVLRNALHSAMREELIFRNVASLVRVPAPAYRVDRGLTIEQAHKLMELAQPDRLHAFFVLAVMLGLRRGELLGLHWSDVDLDGGSLRVVHTLQRVDGALQLVPPKTMSSVRTVPLPGLCVDALTRHRDRQDKERVDAGDAWQDNGLVFVSRVGTPLEPDNLRRHWEPLKTALGVELRFHDLRHTCVSLLLDLGVPPHVVREIVGHADIGVTMQIYAHASLYERRRAMDALDGRLR
ncbi:MAG: tyrosine-type recombinase/integrase [Nocardioidaceae bacterium]